ncbi:MAG: hypothetical protein QXK02_05335, partial [Thermoplasmata archaeon]
FRKENGWEREVRKFINKSGGEVESIDGNLKLMFPENSVDDLIVLETKESNFTTSSLSGIGEVVNYYEVGPYKYIYNNESFEVGKEIKLKYSGEGNAMYYEKDGKIERIHPELNEIWNEITLTNFSKFMFVNESWTIDMFDKKPPRISVNVDYNGNLNITAVDEEEEIVQTMFAENVEKITFDENYTQELWIPSGSNIKECILNIEGQDFEINVTVYKDGEFLDTANASNDNVTLTSIIKDHTNCSSAFCIFKLVMSTNKEINVSPYVKYDYSSGIKIPEIDISPNGISEFVSNYSYVESGINNDLYLFRLPKYGDLKSSVLNIQADNSSGVYPRNVSILIKEISSCKPDINEICTISLRIEYEDGKINVSNFVVLFDGTGPFYSRKFNKFADGSEIKGIEFNESKTNETVYIEVPKTANLDSISFNVTIINGNGSLEFDVLNDGSIDWSDGFGTIKIDISKFLNESEGYRWTKEGKTVLVPILINASVTESPFTINLSIEYSLTNIPEKLKGSELRITKKGVPDKLYFDYLSPKEFKKGLKSLEFMHGSIYRLSSGDSGNVIAYDLAGNIGFASFIIPKPPIRIEEKKKLYLNIPSTASVGQGITISSEIDTDIKIYLDSKLVGEYNTGSSGWITFTPEVGGRYRIIATKGDLSAEKYIDVIDTRALSVSKKSLIKCDVGCALLVDVTSSKTQDIMVDLFDYSSIIKEIKTIKDKSGEIWIGSYDADTGKLTISSIRNEFTAEFETYITHSVKTEEMNATIEINSPARITSEFMFYVPGISERSIKRVILVSNGEETEIKDYAIEGDYIKVTLTVGG